ncbi:MAG TPA: ATP-binding protein [Vicinamibacterales bacterium]|nr:ATP-binding protein [Vicinamibacterales bacterium]
MATRLMQEFPFTAIVGQGQLKTALLLNAVNPRIGGVLIRGERGTAKTTAVRALAAVLPEIDVVADCRFSCDPARLHEACDECRRRVSRGDSLPVARRRVRVVELPVSATEDRVVGTLDLERALQHGERAFQEGVLGAVNRGVLYIDEVNLLDDHLVDLLLDASAKGVNFVEREGISFRHPARFVLVGTMNPEEGELRPQLLDRFGLAVDVSGLTDIEERVAVMERCLAWDEDPDQLTRAWSGQQNTLSDRIARAGAKAESVAYSTADLVSIATLVAGIGAEGHRPDLVTLRAARASAALAGRDRLSHADVLAVVPLVLAHRLPSDAMGRPEVGRLDHLDDQLEVAAQTAAAMAGDPVDAEAAKKKGSGVVR